MYAYDRAMRLGSDMLETDIHVTKDEKIVVIHDSTVDRTTNGTGSVYDMTLDQIQELDGGYWPVPGKGTDHSARPATDYPFRGVPPARSSRRPAPSPRDFRIVEPAQVIKEIPRRPDQHRDQGALRRRRRLLPAQRRGPRRLPEPPRPDSRDRRRSFNDAALAHFHELAPRIDLAPATGGVAGYVLGNVPPPGARRSSRSR